MLGCAVSRLRDTELVELRRRVAYIFQRVRCSTRSRWARTWRSAWWSDGRARPIAARVSELLARVGLPGTEGLSPADLSGGMRKRVALARGLALVPEVILYDEPTAGLDPLTGLAITRLIREVAARDRRHLGRRHPRPRPGAGAGRPRRVPRRRAVRFMGDARRRRRQPTARWASSCALEAFMRDRDRGAASRSGCSRPRCIALLGLSILVLGRKQGLFVRHVTYTTHFDHVAGLVAGAPVWLNGVVVGSVEDVVLRRIPAQRRSRPCSASTPAWRSRIRADSRVRLRTSGPAGRPLHRGHLRLAGRAGDPARRRDSQRERGRPRLGARQGRRRHVERRRGLRLPARSSIGSSAARAFWASWSWGAPTTRTRRAPHLGARAARRDAQRPARRQGHPRPAAAGRRSSASSSWRTSPASPARPDRSPRCSPATSPGTTRWSPGCCATPTGGGASARPRQRRRGRDGHPRRRQELREGHGTLVG